MIDGRKYVMIDRRFGRLCEFDNGVLHGQTADLFWIDVTDQPEITLEWTWSAANGFEPPAPKAMPVAHAVDYGEKTYAFDAGQGLPWHTHLPGEWHDHRVIVGSTMVTVKGQKPEICTAGAYKVLPPDLPHSIIAMEDGTTFINMKI